MHQKVSNLIFDFNFIKILFPKFKFPQNAKLITFSYFKNMQNLGCYNSTPLKMNLVLEIRTTATERQGYSVFRFSFTYSCSPIVLIRIPLYLAYLLILLQVSCPTDYKVLIDTPNDTQVTPITRPPFLLSPQYQFFFLKYPPSDENSLLY